MAKSKRTHAPTQTANVATAAASSASTGTRSKRKAASSVAIAVPSAPPALHAQMGTLASAALTAISPALKKRRLARQTFNTIPFPSLHGTKEIINLYDDDDDDEEQEEEQEQYEDDDDEGFRYLETRSPTSAAAAAAARKQLKKAKQEKEKPVEPLRIANPDIHLPAEYAGGPMRVLQSHGQVYDAMLTRACVYQNQNEYFFLQALEKSETLEFFVWTRWGFVGAPAQTTQMHGPWATASEALAKFREVFLSKTLVQWENRHAQRYGEGGFTWIETHLATVEEEEAAIAAAAAATSTSSSTPPSSSSSKRRPTPKKKSRARATATSRKAKQVQPLTELRVNKTRLPPETSTPPSRLDDQVQSFVSMIINAASLYGPHDPRFFAATKHLSKKAKTNAESGGSSNSEVVLVPLPLGKLSKSTIQRGFEALHRLHDALQCNADRTALTHLSSRFYSVVPHAQLTVLDSMMALVEKVEMLVAHCVHSGHDALLSPELSHRYFHMNHLDASYNSLGCHLTPLLPTSKEYGLIHSYIFNSYCCVGNTPHGAEGKLIEVFRVEKPDEATRFAPYRSADNRRILWHGSRMSNWMGILKHGLLITPSGVQLNGSSLGAGLYFTDKISKAMAYSHASQNRQVFLLSEVALGHCKPTVLTGGRVTMPASGSSSAHHSCHGVGRCIPDATGDYVDVLGATWPLGKPTQAKEGLATHGHNEFVVYNTAQARMRYIVVTRPLY